MIAKVLIYLKRSFPLVWVFVEEINNFLLRIFYSKRLENVRNRFLDPLIINSLSFRLLTHSDQEELFTFLDIQKEEQFKYFRPHAINEKTIARILRKSFFMPFGVFLESRIVGYFFLRLFFTKRAFLGLIAGKEVQGKGIGVEMIKLLVRTAQSLDFTLYSTISINNRASLIAHEKAGKIKIVKELSNNYLLVRFVN